MMRLWLEELGLQHTEASSGEEAIELSDQHDFSVVVLDQRMPPGMTGIETASELRARGYNGPMILHSAYLTTDVEAQAGVLEVPTVEKGDHTGLMAAIEDALRENDQ